MNSSIRYPALSKSAVRDARRTCTYWATLGLLSDVPGGTDATPIRKLSRNSRFVLIGFDLSPRTLGKMKIVSTSQAAKRFGVHLDTLAHYIAVGKLPAPTILEVGRRTIHAWTEEEIENVRKLLPKIANGRKTRYKKQSAISNQQSARPKPQPGAAVP